jgi:hypothetical protein
MKRIFSILFALALALSVGLLAVMVAEANNMASSTMVFKGTLTYQGGGVYTGYIPMQPGTYWAVGGAGYSQRHGCSDTNPCAAGPGGFDVYAKEGGTAFVTGLGIETIGSDHDAYSASGSWGSWYDPDCADWCQWSLELTADHWYLRYTATNESPMSGVMKWHGDGTGFAYETDPGTVKSDHGGNTTDPSEYTAGSAQEWGWHCGWGEERIPLQYRGFHVTVLAGHSPDEVEMDPSDPVGWETHPISKVRVFLPWIALVAAIMAGVSLLVLRRRRA